MARSRTAETDHGPGRTAAGHRAGRLVDYTLARGALVQDRFGHDYYPYPFMNVQEYGYCVFGKVVAGTEVVDQIKKVKTRTTGFHRDVPVDDVVVTSAAIV